MAAKWFSMRAASALGAGGFLLGLGGAALFVASNACDMSQTVNPTTAGVQIFANPSTVTPQGEVVITIVPQGSCAQSLDCGICVFLSPGAAAPGNLYAPQAPWLPVGETLQLQSGATVSPIDVVYTAPPIASTEVITVTTYSAGFDCSGSEPAQLGMLLSESSVVVTVQGTPAADAGAAETDAEAADSAPDAAGDSAADAPAGS
jgi:hypothetical protein